MLQRTYGIRARTVHGLVASGEFFVACGADRRSVRIDDASFATSVLSGAFSEVTADAFRLTLDGGEQVTLAVGDVDGNGTLAIVDEESDRNALWQHGLDALAPPPGRFDADANERQTYEDYLDFYRSILPAKLRGVSEDDARRRFVGSSTTLLGLAKHLIGVERNWFQVALAQRTREDVGPNNRGSDDSWVIDPDETIASVLASYEEVCAESRRTMVRFELTDIVPGHRGQGVSLRMILVHMIEEIARHAGHADIVRELIDGETGVDPTG